MPHVLQMLEPRNCYIPTKRVVDEADALGSNRCYQDLRHLGWRDVRFYLSLEDELLSLIDASKRRLPEDNGNEVDGAEREDLAERVVDDFLERKNQSEMEVVGFLDFGVYSCVAAISACSCVPVSSCNGGEFGGYHNEEHPVVVFHARPSRCTLLNVAAEQARVEVWHHDKVAVVGSEDVDGLRRFAYALLDFHRTIKPDKIQSNLPDHLFEQADSQLKLGL